MSLSDADLCSRRRRQAVEADRGLASSGDRSLRLVVVENSPDYAALVEQMLVESFGAGIEVVRGDTLASAVSALAEQSPIDAILLDLSLPDAAGLEALGAVQRAAPQAPVVVLTGRDDQALAVRAVQEGAQDYLAKSGTDPALLARAVRYAIERKRAELRLAHQALRSRRLVAQILSAEERERNRLAHSLHDGPLQDLAAAQLELTRAAGGNGEVIAAARDAVDRAVVQLREALFDLYPQHQQLEQLGLGGALRALASEMGRRSNLHVSVEITAGASSAHDQLIFSLVRELVSNAERHAAARTVAIRIQPEDGELALEVEDDGAGLPPGRLEAALREGHIGLASSAERVEALGGSLSIRTRPAQGTLIRAAFPARRGTDQTRSAAATIPERRHIAQHPERRSLMLQA
jgi:signal transduction histidine kinase